MGHCPDITVNEAHGVLSGKTHPLSATMQRAPLVGSRRNAKSREGSHISVNVLGR